MNHSRSTDIELLGIANSFNIPLITPTQRFNLQRKIRSQENKNIKNEILIETGKEALSVNSKNENQFQILRGTLNSFEAKGNLN
jgi:hypothetical protein